MLPLASTPAQRLKLPPAGVPDWRRNRGRWGVALTTVLVLLGPAPLAGAAGVEVRPPGAPYKPAFAGQTRAPEEKLGVAFQATVAVAGLRFPWGLAFLPNGRLLVTEREGVLRVVSRDGSLSKPVSGVPPVAFKGQGGLLDVALDPGFADNHRVYLSFSEPQPDGANNTAVARGVLAEGPDPELRGVTIIYRQAPALNSVLHFGSRLVFGRDGTLFVTQGERAVPEGRAQAQDLGSLLGKIVRINPDGSIPSDNPFVKRAGARPEIWSYGHANIQAAMIRPGTRDLWVVEHGPQGGDEINIARSGRNYGWPIISYGVAPGPAKQPIGEGLTQHDGMEQPLYYWDPVISPSGMLFYTGRLFPAWRGSLLISGQSPQGLPGGAITRLTLRGERILGEERLDLPPSAWRDIRQGPDGAIYLLRGGADGKIVKLTPRA